MIKSVIEGVSQTGFINYYGLQRFGRGGGEVSTDAIGRALLSETSSCLFNDSRSPSR